MATYSEALRGNGFPIPEAFDQAVPDDGVFVFACVDGMERGWVNAVRDPGAPYKAGERRKERKGRREGGDEQPRGGGRTPVSLPYTIVRSIQDVPTIVSVMVRDEDLPGEGPLSPFPFPGGPCCCWPATTRLLLLSIVIYENAHSETSARWVQCAVEEKDAYYD